MRLAVRVAAFGAWVSLLATGVLVNAGMASAHGDEGLVIASTAPGGGALTVAYDFAQVVPVTFVTEVLGTSLYTASQPAFSALPADQPLEGLYRLTDGTEVSVEVTALDPGRTAMKVRGTVLDAVGESVVLGVQGAPPPGHLDDQHPELQLLLQLAPGAYGEGTIAFRLTTTAPAYTASAHYTLRLSNGHLAPLALATSAYDGDTVGCQQAIGKAVKGFVASKYQLLAKCLDKLTVVEAREHAGLDAAKAEGAAAGVCGDKLVAAVAKARAKAIAAMLAKCVDSGDLTPEAAAAHVGLVACRVDEMASASYPGAQGILATMTAGGQPVDTYFECLIPAPHGE